MQGKYEVKLADEQIGAVTVVRSGLYYGISCRCRLSGHVIYKLYMLGEGWRVDLGILIPMDGGFGLDTRIPMKRVGNGPPVFRAAPRHTQLQGEFVPISPEEPFAYISRIHQAVLERRNGQTGLRLP